LTIHVHAPELRLRFVLLARRRKRSRPIARIAAVSNTLSSLSLITQRTRELTRLDRCFHDEVALNIVAELEFRLT